VSVRVPPPPANNLAYNRDRPGRVSQSRPRFSARLSLRYAQRETLKFLVRANIKYSQSRPGRATPCRCAGFIWKYSRGSCRVARLFSLRVHAYARTYVRVPDAWRRVCARACARAAADTAQCYLKFRPFIFHQRNRRYRSRKY